MLLFRGWSRVLSFLSERQAPALVESGLVHRRRRIRSKRLARRKERVVRLAELDIDNITALVRKDSPSARLASVEPVTLGFSPATESITKLTFDSDDGRFSVAAKEFHRSRKRSPEWLPREVEITRYMSGVSGPHLLLPRLLDVTESAGGRPLMVTEWVEAAKNKRVFEFRARALGELAGLDPDTHRELTDYLARNPEHKSKGDYRRGIAVAHDKLGKDRAGPIEAAFERQLSRCPNLMKLYGQLPRRFAHGDAQPPNMLIDAHGKVALVDNGSMRLAPAGYDLANLVGARLRGDQDTPEIDGKREDQAIEAFVSSLRASGKSIEVPELGIAYAVGLSNLVRKSFVRISRAGSDEALIERECKIIDRLTAALARGMDRL